MNYRAYALQNGTPKLIGTFANRNVAIEAARQVYNDNGTYVYVEECVIIHDVAAMLDAEMSALKLGMSAEYGATEPGRVV